MVFPKKKFYKLQCEWASCQQIMEDMDLFYRHLEDHFWNDVASFPMQPGSTVVCQWCECNFATTDGHELVRHIYFHGFHTKVKSLGMKMHESTKLDECQIQQNRNIIPDLPDGFRCCWEDCNVIVDIPDKFYDHVYEHAVILDEEKFPDNKKGFRCHWEGCSYSYELQEKQPVSFGRHKLKGHLRSHTQERSYACPWCGNLYVNKTKLIDHFARQINVEHHGFQCTHCSRTFASERILKDHMRHHVNHYQCPMCAMTCPNPSALKHHIRYKHSTERPYACEFCEYRSKEPHDLQTHMQFHQSDLAFHCQVADCDYVVRSLQNLRYHYRVKHGSGDGKYYACHLCDKKYATGYQLTPHLRKAHNFQWPPGHCRFRYKECEDGKFRLQTFRYESIELTEQLTTSVEPSGQKKSDNMKASSSIEPHKASTKAKRKAVIRKKVGPTFKRGAATESTSAPKNTNSGLKVTRLSATRGRPPGTKKTPAKTKNKRNSPKKKTKIKTGPVPSKRRKGYVSRATEHLPDLYINTEFVEAAGTLCNLRSNSAKKKKLEAKSRKAIGQATTDIGRNDSNSSLLAEIMDAGAFDTENSETDLPNEDAMCESSLPEKGKDSSEVSTRKRKQSHSYDLKFSKARKRLDMLEVYNETITEQPHATILSITETSQGNPCTVMDCYVDLESIDNPVFPDHDKIFYNALPPVSDVISDPSTQINTPIDPSSLSLTTLTQVNPNAFDRTNKIHEDTSLPSSYPISNETNFTDIIAMPPQSEDILNLPPWTGPGTSGEDSSTWDGAESSSTLPDRLQTHTNITTMSTPEANTMKMLKNLGGCNNLKETITELQDRRTGSGLNEELDNSNNIEQNCKNKEKIFEEDDNQGKTVEVNKSEIVRDEDGARTTVTVGDEEYYLVSGTDVKGGDKVYCLVKTSEFVEDDSE